MTQTQYDEIIELKDEISEGIAIYLDDKTKHLTPAQDEALRCLLGEQFRFWRK